MALFSRHTAQGLRPAKPDTCQLAARCLHQLGGNRQTVVIIALFIGKGVSQNSDCRTNSLRVPTMLKRASRRQCCRRANSLTSRRSH